VQAACCAQRGSCEDSVPAAVAAWPAGECGVAAAAGVCCVPGRSEDTFLAVQLHRVMVSFLWKVSHRHALFATGHAAFP